MQRLPDNRVLAVQSEEAYTELVVQIDVLSNKLKKIMNEDVVKLNQLIDEKTLPVIGLKKDKKSKTKRASFEALFLCNFFNPFFH